MSLRGLANIGWLNRAAKRAVDRLPYFPRKVVLDAIHNGVRNRPPFSGVYASFEDVTNIVYPAPETQFEFVKSGISSMKPDPASGLTILRRSHALLPLAVAMMSLPARPLRILDFGGSGGIDYVGVTKTTDADVRYHIVETAATCEAGRKLWANDPRISFSETMPPEQEQFDIVYAWSAVQYVSDPLALMASFARYNPRVILIVGSPFAPRAFVRSQEGPGSRYPHWVVSLPDAERVMRDAGYRLALRAVDETDFNVDNYAPEYRVGSSAILGFTRA